MRVALLNTGTEVLLGDVQEAHLRFIAREILPLGLRIAEQRAVPDDAQAIRTALNDLFSRSDIMFITGGLGPTSDDLTCEVVAQSLGLKLERSAKLLAALEQRFKMRGFKWTERVARQADVPAGAQVLANDNGSAPGFYLPANINPQIQSPHIFVLPGPSRELQPMFRDRAMSILCAIVADASPHERRLYKIAGISESAVEEAIGEQVFSIPGLELGYCARPGEVDVRIIGTPDAIRRADEIIRTELGKAIFTTVNETLEEVVVKLLAERKQTLAIAESCTGGLLANRITNVSGASEVFLAGYVTYANDAKIDILRVEPELLEKHGAVSEPVARMMTEGARARARSTYAMSTTGIAGPSGGSAEKPAGTVYVGLASANQQTIVKKFFFPSDRETFKQLTTQAALDLLRRRLVSINQ
ncbi:MAG TPA: competence/damage-inducible protein A [Chthoniobacterales bacterium]|nr:competence/damage-inducible protein A [Chthoniobacterales bacterium]